MVRWFPHITYDSHQDCVLRHSHETKLRSGFRQVSMTRLGKVSLRSLAYLASLFSAARRKFTLRFLSVLIKNSKCVAVNKTIMPSTTTECFHIFISLLSVACSFTSSPFWLGNVNSHARRAERER